MKSVQIRSSWKVFKYRVCSGPYFPIFGQNTRKYGPEKTPYLDSFHTVIPNWYMYLFFFIRFFTFCSLSITFLIHRFFKTANQKHCLFLHIRDFKFDRNSILLFCKVTRKSLLTRIPWLFSIKEIFLSLYCFIYVISFLIFVEVKKCKSVEFFLSVLGNFLTFAYIGTLPSFLVTIEVYGWSYAFLSLSRFKGFS